MPLCKKYCICAYFICKILPRKSQYLKCFVSSLISYKLTNEPVQIQNAYFNTKYSYIQSITALLKDATALNFDVWRHRGLAKASASGCFLYKQTYLILLLYNYQENLIHTADSGRPFNANSCRVSFNSCTMTFLGRFLTFLRRGFNVYF